LAAAGSPRRERVADLRVADALEPGRHVADVAGVELLHGNELRPEEAELDQLGLGAGAHQPDVVVLVERSLGEADVDDHALVRVVVRVEDQALERRLGIALGRRDPLHDRLEDLGDAGAVLGRRQQHFFARHRQDALQLLDDHIGLGRRQVDLVEDRDDRQVLLEGEVDVGERLGLDALGGVDDEDRALTGLELRLTS
jgi:hypothetical protein